MFSFRRTRKFVRTVLFVALGLYLLAHLLIRTDWIGGRVLRTISERTGYEAAASRVRLTAALALSFEDFSLSYREGAATNVVFSAPHLRFGWCCGRSAEAVRAQIFVRRTAGGTTVPSQFRPSAGIPVAPDDLPRAVSPQFGELLFRLTDSTLTVSGEGEDVVYDGLTWLREPVRLEGHPGAVQNVLTVQAVRPVEAEGGSFAPHELRDEWFELEGRSVRFASDRETAAPAAPVAPAEPASASVEPAPAEPASAEPASAEPASAEPAEPASAEPAPVEPAPEPVLSALPLDDVRFPSKASMQDAWLIHVVLRFAEGTKFEPPKGEESQPPAPSSDSNESGFLWEAYVLDRALYDAFGEGEVGVFLSRDKGARTLNLLVAVPRDVSMADALRLVQEKTAKDSLPAGVSVESVRLCEIPPEGRGTLKFLKPILDSDAPSDAPAPSSETKT